MQGPTDPAVVRALHALEASSDPASVLRCLDASALPAAHRAKWSDSSRILHPYVVRKIEACLPAPARGHAWRLAYSLTRDGASLATMLTRAGEGMREAGTSYSVLAIKDEHGGVFGAFAGSAWAIASKNAVAGRYFGLQASCVFTCENVAGADATRARLLHAEASVGREWEEGGLTGQAGQEGEEITPPSDADNEWRPAAAPDADGVGQDERSYGDWARGAVPPHCPPAFSFFKRTGRNDYNQYLAIGRVGLPTSIGAGGGGHFALLLDAALLHGRSGPCATYLSPPLCCLRGMAPEATAEAVREAVARVTGEGGEGSGHGRSSELSELGPDCPFKAVDVELWTLGKRSPRDVDV